MVIKEIIGNQIIVSFDKNITTNLMNNYLIFQDTRLIVGEIIEVGENLKVNLVGEIINNNFIYGINNKPSLQATVNLVNPDYIPSIISYPNNINSLFLGNSPIYQKPIYMNLDTFFNSHFAIIGGSGSGKSFALSRIIQTLFMEKEYVPYNASLFVFDTYGEYQNSFTNIENQNSYISYKNYTTNLESNDEILKIPPYLLGVDDLAILLNAETANQLQILEKALELVTIFRSSGADILKIKNNIIARAVLDILLSGRPSVQIRDQIFSVLSFYKTEELNLETEITQPGYTRALKHCLIIDADGKIREIELLTNFFTKYLLSSDEYKIPKTNISYSLKDLEDAIDFALISEGILKSEKVYDNNNMLKIRIHNLVEGEYKVFFDYNELVTREEYVNSLITKNNKKAQLINFNINYVDDRFAKNIVKIITKMLFDVVKNIKPRASLPFHIILEEAHRYVLKDNDIDLLGYNIFERIAKEGRKYGILLGLITQRPSELSETVISQCNNFLVFKMTHPKDSEYINRLIPFLTEEISKRLQIIQPGNCYVFGPAFKLPTLITLDKPNPTPESNNVNIINTWFRKKE